MTDDLLCLRTGTGFHYTITLKKHPSGGWSFTSVEDQCTTGHSLIRKNKCASLVRGILVVGTSSKMNSSAIAFATVTSYARWATSPYECLVRDFQIRLCRRYSKFLLERKFFGACSTLNVYVPFNESYLLPRHC